MTGSCGTRMAVNSWMKEDSFDKKCVSEGLSPCTDVKNAPQVRLHVVGCSQKKSKTRNGDVVHVLGKLGQSCSNVCSSKKLSCDPNAAEASSNCHDLRAAGASCPSGCVTVSTLITAPGFRGSSERTQRALSSISPAVVETNGTSICVFKTCAGDRREMFQKSEYCNTRHRQGARLCACYDKRKRIAAVMQHKGGK